MSKSYTDSPTAPICLHALGQDLVNALFAEAKILREQRDQARAASQPAMHVFVAVAGLRTTLVHDRIEAIKVTLANGRLRITRTDGTVWLEESSDIDSLTISVCAVLPSA